MFSLPFYKPIINLIALKHKNIFVALRNVRRQAHTKKAAQPTGPPFTKIIIYSRYGFILYYQLIALLSTYRTEPVLQQ